MAGHSKWANIQHRKGTQDARRGKLFTKLIREITVAARLGGGELSANPRLRAAVDKALSANMTKDTVERAIKRGVGGLEGPQLEEVRYEGYAPGGVAVMVDCLTDNRNRTVSDVRHAFHKCGGHLGTDGSVAYLFAERGVLSYPAGSDEGRIWEAALEVGAEDVVTGDDGAIDVWTLPDRLADVKQAMDRAGLSPESAELTQRARTIVRLEAEHARTLMKLWEMLDDLDDVQNVYSNADLIAEALREVE